jgi:nucleoside-diphosphate-sugar epimerase
MAQTQAAKALKVLIGGGTGFIGKHVSGILRNRGHQVRKLSDVTRCRRLK